MKIYRIKRKNSTDYIGSLKLSANDVYSAFYKSHAKIWKTRKGAEKALKCIMKNDRDNWEIEEDENDL